MPKQDSPLPGIKRVIAPNASPMTEGGTNSYLLGAREVAIIDPGPDDQSHIDALVAAVPARAEVTHILVTHSHIDHSTGARALADRLNAPIFAYGDSHAGRSPHMDNFDGLGGGEGVDPSFEPDFTLKDGEEIRTRDWHLCAHWTPGHFGNHMVFETGACLFTGDHVMGWAPSLVSPPDGDLTAFMASLEKLLGLPNLPCLPGHGTMVDDGHERINWLLSHRRAREAQILASLETPKTISTLVAEIYADIPSQMHPMAARNVLAHLIDLFHRDLVTAKPELTFEAEFHRI